MTNITSIEFKKKPKPLLNNTEPNKILFDQLDINTDELYIPYSDYVKIEVFLPFYPGLKYIKEHITFIPIGKIVF